MNQIDYFKKIHKLAYSIADGDELYMQLASYGVDPSGVALMPLHEKFDVSDPELPERMAATVQKWSEEPHRNIYLPCALYGPELSGRGKKDQIQKVFGLVADFDDAKANEWADRVPADPDMVLETSPTRFQTFFLFENGLEPEAAEAYAKALCDYSGADSCSRDIGHVWRIPGTLNCPTPKKIAAGRSQKPFQVKTIKPFTGASQDEKTWQSLDSRPAEPKPTPQIESDQQEPYLDWDGDIASLNLPEKIQDYISGRGTGDRSADLWAVENSFVDMGLSDEDTIKIILENPIGEKAREKADPESWLQSQIDKIRTERSNRPNLFEPVPGPPQDEKWGGFRLISRLEARKSLKPPDWLVEGYFERDLLISWFGEPGSFKSFMALDLGLSIATGDAWAGRHVQRGSVFYLAGEGINGLSRRLEAACINRGINPTADIPFYLGSCPIQFDGPEAARQVVKSVEMISSEHGEPTALFIDTLSTAFSGNENDAGDMNRFLRLLDAEIRAPLGVSVFIIHHSGHQEKQRYRGSSAFHGRLDAIYRIDRDKDDPMAVCLRTPMKLKDGRPPVDTWFRARVVRFPINGDTKNLVDSLALNPEPLHVERKAFSLGGNQGPLFNMILETDGEVRVEDLKDQFQALKKEEGSRFNPSVFYRTLRDLEKKCLITWDRDGGTLSRYQPGVGQEYDGDVDDNEDFIN